LEPQKDVLLFGSKAVDILERAAGCDVMLFNVSVDNRSLQVKAIVNFFASLSSIRH
jgi:hypothetical protein